MGYLTLKDVSQPLAQLLLSGINRQMNSIETGVTFWVWIPLIVFCSFNCEPHDLVSIALQIFKPQNGNPRSPSHIVNKLPSFLLVLALHELPKPLHLLVIRLVPFIVSVTFPIIDIDI